MKYIFYFLNFHIYTCFNFLTNMDVDIRKNRILQTGTCYKSVTPVSYSDCLDVFKNDNYSVNVVTYERRYLLCNLCYVSETPLVVKVAPGSVLVYHPLEGDGWGNLAEGKPSSQSSTYFVNASRGYASSNLSVDGVWESNMTLYHDKYMCSLMNSQASGDSWWMVDLEHIYPVSTVVVLNRGDCCWETLHTLTITIGETQDDMHLCSEYDGPGGAGEIVTVTCENPLLGRFVRISKPATEVLQFCEVGVYS